jgi:hypothetical protein
MWLFVAMSIGVIGIILIERFNRKPDNEAIMVPVRIDDRKSNHSVENYRR